MREILRRNLGYKLISLIFAIIFWVWITSQSAPPTIWGNHTLTVPLVTYNQPPNLVVLSDIPPITVRLDGDNRGINVKDLFAYVDLKDAVAGEQSFEVHMDAPEGVIIKDISPRSVVLRLDTVKDKIVPVNVKITGSPSSGFVAGEPIVSPPVVNVRGPSSILEKLENVVVEVNVTGAQESLKVARPVTFKDLEGKGIFAPDPNLETLNAFPGTVEIIVPVYSEGLASKMVPLKATTRGTPASGMTVRLVTPIPPRVQVLGNEDVLKGLQSIDIGSVNVNGLSSNKVYNIALEKITLPEGVTFAEGTKISVMVYIGPDVENKTIKGVPVGIRNIPEGLSAEPIPSINLTVSGYPDVLQNLKIGDISVWVDASDLKEGVYSDTEVLWEVPSGVKMVSVPKVKLVLKKNTTETGQPGDTG